MFCFIGTYLRSTSTHLRLYLKNICLTLVPSSFYQKTVLSPGKYIFSLREYILDCTSISSLDIDISFDNCFDNFYSLAYFQKWWMSFDSLNLFLESWIQKNALTLFIVKMALSKKRRLESSGTFSQDHFSTC